MKCSKLECISNRKDLRFLYTIHVNNNGDSSDQSHIILRVLPSYFTFYSFFIGLARSGGLVFTVILLEFQKQFIASLICKELPQRTTHVDMCDANGTCPASPGYEETKIHFHALVAS